MGVSFMLLITIGALAVVGLIVAAVIALVASKRP
jgi:hypothetical protein